MKPIEIKQVLDLTLKAREKNQIFNPLFTGDAGVGKSFICQQWAADQRAIDPNFGFIDLRIAYMEAPDVIGFPSVIVDENGVQRTTHNLPEIWPTSGRGLLLIEEPNRGTTGIMNCLMQITTDRRVHKYKLPDGWIIAACINPDSAEYDVNAMDAALKNRFVEYEIKYDHNAFVEYIEAKNWNQNIQMFIRSGAWLYKEAKSIGRDGKYISPRTWEQMNAAELAGVADMTGTHGEHNMHYQTATSILGGDIGKEYYSFIYNEAPVTVTDLLKSQKKAFDRLVKQSDPQAYKGDMIGITIDSIVKNFAMQDDDDKKGQKVGITTTVAVAKIIPSDQAVNLLREVGTKYYAAKMGEFFKDITTKYPELITVLKGNLKVTKK